MSAQKEINLADDFYCFNAGNIIMLSGTVLVINRFLLSQDLQGDSYNSVIYLENPAERIGFLISLIKKHKIRGIIGKTNFLEDEMLECLRKLRAVYFFATNYPDQAMIESPLKSKSLITLKNFHAAVILDAKGRYLLDTT